jgi:hypothetical protein
MGTTISSRRLFASLAGCRPEELVNFRETADGGAIAVIPGGQKLKFTADELARKETLLAASALPAGELPLSPALKPPRKGKPRK